MLPDLEDMSGAMWPLLPAGIHTATLAQVAHKFASNAHRKKLFRGLIKGLRMLKSAGCKRVFLDGSFATGKPLPNDYDACWDMTGIDYKKLDPVILDFNDKRKAQKIKYLGEYFPMNWPADHAGRVFLEFFQTEKDTGKPKGIIEILLGKEAL